MEHKKNLFETPKNKKTIDYIQELQHGLKKEVVSGWVNYKKEVVIDGLHYLLLLIGPRNKAMKEWTLSFTVEGTEAITNKGLKVYNQLIDQVSFFIKDVLSFQKIPEISFYASSETIRFEEIEKFKTMLMDVFKKEPEKFNGFIFHESGKSFSNLFKIENGIVTIDEIYKNNLKNKLLQQSRTDNYYKEFKLRDFINDNAEISLLMDNEPFFKKICDHLGIIFNFEKNLTRNTSIQRMNLYERSLKQKFPEYRFERRGGVMHVFLT